MFSAKFFLVYILQSSTMLGINPNIDINQASCLAENIYYEAGNESRQGQIAVASVTINRTNSTKFPSTVCDVVQQQVISKYTKKPICAFTWVCDRKNIPFRNKDGSVNQKVVDQFQRVSIIALRVLNGDIIDNTNGATYFHNPNFSQPAWQFELRKTVTIGNHDFYKG